MPIWEPYSKRRRLQQEGNKPFKRKYDRLPEEFRNQVCLIWDEALVESGPQWDFIYKEMRKIIGKQYLVDLPFYPEQAKERCYECHAFLLSRVPVEQHLDLIELSFVVIENLEKWVHPRNWTSLGIMQWPNDAIQELNYRFREHQLGYQFAGGRLIRIDSEYAAEEVVKPAITLLHDEKFEGASDEFMKAHEHFRHGRHEDAITNALKAFESTMKTICDERRWQYKPTDNAKQLIDVVLSNDLVPQFFQSHFTGLRTTLEGGLPTVRNKRGGHGKGSKPIEVPEYLASYAIHLAASNIILLVQAHRLNHVHRTS